MSDFEINKEVLIKTKYYDDISDRQVKKDSAVSWGDGCNWHRFDPCNNPADAWPIIIGNRIALHPLHPVYVNEWRASAEDDCGFIGYSSSNASPLRAAMIVFLMVKDAENGL